MYNIIITIFLICKYINKQKKSVIGSKHINVNINNIDD